MVAVALTSWQAAIIMSTLNRNTNTVQDCVEWAIKVQVGRQEDQTEKNRRRMF